LTRHDRGWSDAGVRRSLVSVALAAALVSCKGGGDQGPDPLPPLERLQPTLPTPLSPGNVDGQDEDPSILVARDGGALYAAWYSNRAGRHSSGRERKELFVARSVDGIAWTDPVQVTSHAEWSFYPSLAQSADGVFHLAWMRWRLIPDGCAPDTADPCSGFEQVIVYSQSPDGLTWDPSNEVTIADGPGDELPSLVAASDGRLLVYFDSTSGSAPRDIRVAVNAGTGWDPPQAVTGVNSDVESDTYPHVIERAPGSFVMAWTRHPTFDPLTTGTSEVMLSQSADGLGWTPPIVASGPSPARVDVFPYLFPDHAGERWSVLWVTESGVLTQPVDDPLPLANLDPAGLGTLDLPGYTPRVAPSPTPAISWAAWAEDPEQNGSTQKVRHRFLAR
jgi:hypothetical protein